MQDLKNWRISKGLSQSEIADKVGSNQKSYSAYETGRTKVPGEVQAKLKKLGFPGPFPHEKTDSAEVSRDELDALRADLEDACEVIRFLISQVPSGSRPGVLPRRFR